MAALQQMRALVLIPMLIGSAAVAGDRSIFDDEGFNRAVKPGPAATRPGAAPPSSPATAPAAPPAPIRPKPVEPQRPPEPPKPPPPPPEPDPAAMFSSLYGSDARRIEASASPKDDVEFGQRLLAAARVSTDAPIFQRLLYERAADYAGRDPAGSQIALSALITLRNLYPGDAGRWEERAVAIQEKAYRAASVVDRPAAGLLLRTVLIQVADRQVTTGHLSEALQLARHAAEVSRAAGGEEAAEAQELVRTITDRQKLDQRATKLIERLTTEEGSKDPAAAAELAALVCSVLPSRILEASSLIKATPSPQLKYLLDLINAPHHALTPQQVAWAGDWFRAAAEIPANAAFRPALLRRSAEWYAHHLAIHLPLDPERLRILLSAQQVAERLSKVERRDRVYGFSLSGQSAPLLTLVQPERHRISGNWTAGPAGLAVDSAGAPVAALVLPVAPGDSYELSLQYSVEGSTAVGLMVPIGRSSSAAITRSGTDCAITNVAGAARPLGGQLPDLQKDTERHTLYVRTISRGTSIGILVAVDGQEVGRWEGREKDLSPSADVVLPVRAAIGVFIRGGRALVMDASVHCLSVPPQLLTIPGPSDLPLDGSCPRDALIEQPTPTSARFFHAGASVTFDPAVPNGITVTIAEPSEDIRLLKIGFTKMMENGASLAPLRIEYPRYRRLLALVQEIPKFCSEADAAKLKELYKERETAAGAEKKAAAERAIFVQIHGVAERYRKSANQWLRYMEQTLTPAEIQLAGKFSK